MNAHTPGPWTAEPQALGLAWQVVAEGVGYGPVVAQAFGDATTGATPEANARLVALAPYLYQIADELVAEADAGHHGEGTAVTWARHALEILSRPYEPAGVTEGQP